MGTHKFVPEMLDTTLSLISLIIIIFIANILQDPQLFFKNFNNNLETSTHKIKSLPLFYSTNACQDFQVDLDENRFFEFQAHKIKQNITSHWVQGRIRLDFRSNKDNSLQKCTSSEVKIVCPKTKNYCATLSKPKNRKFIKLDRYLKMLLEGSLDDSSCDFYESKNSLLPFKTVPGSF